MLAYFRKRGFLAFSLSSVVGVSSALALGSVPAQATSPQASVPAVTSSLWTSVPASDDNPDADGKSDRKNVPSGEFTIGGKESQEETTPQPKKPTPICNDCDGPPTPGGTTQRPVEETVLADEKIWFYEDKQVTVTWAGGAGFSTWNYFSIYAGRCISDPSVGITADNRFPYDGNGIPLPKQFGEAPETRNVAVSIKAVQQRVLIETPYEGTKTDKTTGTTSKVILDPETAEFYRIIYTFDCFQQTAPGISMNPCATSMRGRLDGPFDQRMKPMKSVEEGGTNTRQPKILDGDPSIGTEGKEVNDNSLYGKAMERDGINARSGVPSMELAFAHCVPREKDTFGKEGIDSTNSLGRYVVDKTFWYSNSYFYEFITANRDKVFPTATDTNKENIRNVEGSTYNIIENTSPYPKSNYGYAKLVCATGTSPGGLVNQLWVAPNTTRSWSNVNWGDSDPEYYEWNCGDDPANPNEPRTNDFLQCDTYGQRATAPYQFDRLDYTYSSGTRDVYGWKTVTQFMDRGADYINGQWIGRPCPAGWYDAGHNCAQDRQEWGVVGQESYNIKNPTPPGYQDNGSYWFKKAAPPAGWIDNGTEYETTTYSNIIVDNKNAAPIRSANAIVNGEVQPLEYKNGVYRIGSAADPVHVNWEQPLITTRGGKDVNVAGKNQVWEFKYELAPWSSPRLKNAPVNEFDQPYHGWVDEAGAAAAANIPVDRKWEPDKFYENLTKPYTYKYLDYTYTKSFDYKPYTYTTPRRVWVKTGPGGCTCRPTDWSGTGCPQGGTMHDGCCLDCWEDGYWTTVYDQKDPPPSGYYDDGRQYVKETQVKDPAPAGWEDTGTNYRQKNPPPPGYIDSGSEYISIDKVNRSGKMGGIAFDKWMTWPSTPDDPLLKDCQINMSDYGSTSGGKNFTIRCGDNVTSRTHAAYFRYFQSTTAGQRGWQVTPWWRVTADVQTDFTEITGFQPQPNGSIDFVTGSTSGKWLRESYECPGEPFLINIERIATN
jgi:hypothetical protein